MIEAQYDADTWIDEPGASNGYRREDRLDAPGFAPKRDRLFRSHFQRANRLADRAFEQVQPAYELGYLSVFETGNERRAFEEIERDLEEGWLNVRTYGGDWEAVRVFARAGFDAARQGRVDPYPETD
jgi:hypothetical protein